MPDVASLISFWSTHFSEPDLLKTCQFRTLHNHLASLAALILSDHNLRCNTILLNLIKVILNPVVSHTMVLTSDGILSIPTDSALLTIKTKLVDHILITTRTVVSSDLTISTDSALLANLALEISVAAVSLAALNTIISMAGMLANETKDGVPNFNHHTHGQHYTLHPTTSSEYQMMTLGTLDHLLAALKIEPLHPRLKRWSGVLTLRATQLKALIGFNPPYMMTSRCHILAIAGGKFTNEQLDPMCPFCWLLVSTMPRPYTGPKFTEDALIQSQLLLTHYKGVYQFQRDHGHVCPVCLTCGHLPLRQSTTTQERCSLHVEARR